MIEYRSFRNTDPPRLVELWHACDLGRGAALGFSNDAFEALVLGKIYFDRHGLIVACEGADVVGFVHAGFGCQNDGSNISNAAGTICAVMVHPDYRRQGIGRELVSRAESYLRQAGTAEVAAGPVPNRDPFYFGLYGGAQPAGFLESDPAAGPFFEALGYVPFERHAVLERDIREKRDPVNFRLTMIRRKVQTVITDQPICLTWWWSARLGQLDSLEFLLVPKGGGNPLATATVVGLDLYMNRWQERAVGLIDVTVAENERRQGYGQTLVVEIVRRLREELVTRIEAHAPECNPAAIGLLESAGFSRIDTGVGYRRTLAQSPEATADEAASESLQALAFQDREEPRSDGA